MSAIGYLPRRAFWQNFCVNLSIQTQYFRESLMRAFWSAGLRTSNERTHKSSHCARELWLLCLNWQSLHEFSYQHRYQRVLFRSHLCARALSAPRWWRNKWQLIIQHMELALNKSEWFVHFFFSFFPSLLLQCTGKPECASINRNIH